jgi:two-component system NtrC family sensor kinase
LIRACFRPAPDLPHLPSIFLEKGERKTIGRAPQADVVIDEPSLSRVHAAVSMTADGALSVEDLGSTNGVFINRSRQKSGALAEGDHVVFGVLDYLVEEAPEVHAFESLDSTIYRSLKVEDPQRRVDATAIEGLLATSRELMGCTDLAGLLDRVLDRLQPVLKPDRSAILLFDAASGDLTTRAVRPDGAYTSVSDFASSTIVREAIRAREILEVCDAALESRLPEAISLARAGVRSALCVPLLGRTGPIGALYADQVWYAGRFSPEQVQ